MEKLEKEVRWGAMLGLLQSDGGKLIAIISNILTELRVEQERHKERCIDEAIKPETDALYQRSFKLYSEVGGLYYILRGADGVLSSLICEMLDDLKV